ncbi:MAG: hypothetical protein DWQ05_10815 [Calditrichaeota bacterium]|nr:MAG: hypothetical protein DWQ05_10815 [Calditrichota bacterium]
MAAFFGLLDFAKPAQQAPRQALRKMAAVHGASLKKHASLYADGWIGTGCLPERFQSLNRPDVFYQNENLLVFVEGEITNRASVSAMARIPSEKRKEIPLPELVHHAFLSRGPALFDELDGFYRIVIWNSAEKSAFIVGDRNGFWPIYYMRDHARFIWGSEIKFILSILDKTPPMNIQAISDFLRLGYVFDGSTFFTAIRQLPGGHFIHLSENSLHILQGCTNEVHRHNSGDKDEAVARLRNAALTGIKALTHEKSTGILLSGGIDSRLLASASQRLGIKTPFITYGDSQSSDVNIAREVASRTDDEFICCPSDPSRFVENFKRAVWLSDGLLNGAYSHSLNVIDCLKKNPIQLLEGLQPVRGPYYLFEHKMWAKRKWNNSQKLWLAERLFPFVYHGNESQSYFPELGFSEHHANLASAEDRLKSISASWTFEGESAQQTIASLYRQLNHQYFKSRINGLLRHYVPVYNPFYLFLYTDFVENFPAAWQAADRSILREIIHELNPQMIQIPWQGTQLSLDRSPVIEYGSRGWQFLKSHFFQNEDEKTRLSHRQFIFNFSHSLRTNSEIRAFVIKTLFDDLPDSLFQPEEIKKLLNSALKNNDDLEQLITRIMTVNLWYKYFVAGKKPDTDVFHFQELDKQTAF